MFREIDSEIPQLLAEVDEKAMALNHIRWEQHFRDCQPCRFERGITKGDDPSVMRKLIIHFVETER